MSQKIIPIEHDKFYHIYNCGINGENLFHEKANYIYFLEQYDKYIEPIAETFAWCLMPNHIHFLVRIKDENEISFIPRKNEPLSGQKATDRVILTPTAVANPVGGLIETDNLKKDKKYNPSNQFSHLFNSYAQSINKKHNRHRGLFERPFRRIWVDSEKYYKNLVIYIHNNPVHHNFTENFETYPWTSYKSIKSQKPTKLKRNDVIEWFDDIDNFVYLHKLKNNDSGFDKYIIE
ncbi:MAG: hypothetical protein K8R54_19785 [Bacteroidales bacterium]|nr:hypothetical protein [Bacteroidales bacterium]